MNRNDLCYFKYRWKDTYWKRNIKNIRKLSRNIILRSFSIFVSILLRPIDFFELREDTILIISYLPVELRKKESWDLFLRKLDKCFIGIFILSLVLAVMKVKKFLNMFAISTGFVLVASLETRILGLFDGFLFILKIDFIPFQVFEMLSQLLSYNRHIMKILLTRIYIFSISVVTNIMYFYCCCIFYWASLYIKY